MAITISGENNNDKILASDGVIDQISGINIVGVLTATTFKGNLTGNVTGNLTGNVNSTSPLLLQTGGSERIRLTSNNEIGIAGANYGSSGQVLTSGGSGSAVSWTTIPTQVTIANNADNRVITGGSGVNLNGEANLTYDGSELFADNSILTVQKTGAGSGASKLQLQPYGTDGYINCTASGNLYTRMGTGFTTRTQIDSNGNFTVSSGNLVIGTAGKGIDFSATSDATHTAVTSGAQPSTDSEVLTDYEHGTWTPRLRAYDHAGGAGWNTMKYTDGTEVTGTGRYVRMGNHVWAGFKFESGSKVFDSSWTYWSIDSTPYGANHYDKASGSLYVSQTNFFTDSNSHIGGFVHGNESYMVVNKPNGHSNATINTSNNNRYCYGHISIYTSRT